MKKTFAFAICIVKQCEHLNEKKQFVISTQLLKSGTSIGANVFEAQYAESRMDFIHKMKIASKEAGETLYWLQLLEKIQGYEVQNKIIADLNEIIAILTAIITTSKRNGQN